MEKGKSGMSCEPQILATFTLPRERWISFLIECKKRGTSGSAVLRSLVDSWLDSVLFEAQVEEARKHGNRG